MQVFGSWVLLFSEACFPPTANKYTFLLKMLCLAQMGQEKAKNNYYVQLINGTELQHLPSIMWRWGSFERAGSRNISHCTHDGVIHTQSVMCTLKFSSFTSVKSQTSAVVCRHQCVKTRGHETEVSQVQVQLMWVTGWFQISHVM